jgi:hypothetical protein
MLRGFFKIIACRVLLLMLVLRGCVLGTRIMDAITRIKLLPGEFIVLIVRNWSRRMVQLFKNPIGNKQNVQRELR